MHEAITAYERMREEYRVRPEEKPFDYYVDNHPFVFKRPDVFLVCRPIMSSAGRDAIADLEHEFHWSECDCWCVWMLAGNIAKAWDFMPWFLPLICFQRALDPHKELRFYKTKSLQRLTLTHANYNLHDYATA